MGTKPRWSPWGERLLDPRYDHSALQGARLYINLHNSRDSIYLADLDEKVGAARSLGLKVMLLLDFHVEKPYHGPPPGRERREEHYGYAPFGWTRGWIWAREAVTDLMLRYDPEYMQIADDPHIRNGWIFFNDQNDPAKAAYLDTMSLFRQGLSDAGWQGIVVIPECPFQKYAIKRSMEARPYGGNEGPIVPGWKTIDEKSMLWVLAVPVSDDPPEEPPTPVEPPVEPPEDPSDLIDPPLGPPMPSAAIIMAEMAMSAARNGNWKKAIRRMRKAKRLAR